MSIPIKIGIIGGSGLNDPDLMKNRQEKQVTTPFGDPSDVMITGEIGGVSCVLLARHGRKHSVMPGNVNFRANVWALKQENCTHVLASNACGSLREELKPGDLVLCDSFIDRTQGRKQTFHDGDPDHPAGICHLPIEPDPFNKRLRQILAQTACKMDIQIHSKGTVVVIEGPRYSSKAESEMYRLWGGDLVNMTLVPEVVLMRESGMFYAVVAMVTDYDSWRDLDKHTSHDVVLKTFQENVEKLKRLIIAAVPRIAEEDWGKQIKEHREYIESTVVLPGK